MIFPTWAALLLKNLFLRNHRYFLIVKMPKRGELHDPAESGDNGVRTKDKGR